MDGESELNETIEMNDLDSAQRAYEADVSDNFNETEFNGDPIIDVDIPDEGRDAGIMKRSFVRDKKDFLKDLWAWNLTKVMGRIPR